MNSEDDFVYDDDERFDDAVNELDQPPPQFTSLSDAEDASVFMETEAGCEETEVIAQESRAAVPHAGGADTDKAPFAAAESSAAPADSEEAAIPNVCAGPSLEGDPATWGSPDSGVQPADHALADTKPASESPAKESSAATPKPPDNPADDYSAIRWEVNRGISENLPVHKYEGYTAPQLRQIRLALREGSDNCVSVLVRHKFNYLQMELIRKGFEEGLAIETYAKPEFDVNQMWEIMEGLRYGLEVDTYADDKFSSEQMEVLREALMEGVDTATFSDAELTPEQMQYRKRQAGVRKAPLKDRFKRAYNILRGPQKKKDIRERPDY